MQKNRMKSAELQKIIHDISFKQKLRMEIFKSLSSSLQAEIILHLTKHIQYDILSQLTTSEIIDTVEYLDPDELTDLLQLIPIHKRNKIISKLNKELRETITKLLQFNPETAGGLMNVDYIEVDENESISEALKKFKIHEKRTGRLPAIIATRDEKTIGYIPGHELGFAKPYEKIKKYIRHIETIQYSASHTDVINKFRTYPHNKLAVIGSKGNIMGIIYSDDILHIIREQSSKSLYNFAGVSKEEQVQDGPLTKVEFRYKWLIINLGTAFLAAFVVKMFDSTIAKYVLLAVYMPVVAGMGGNAATQTLAVLVRGIAFNQISLSNAWKTIRNEVISGFINGIITGALAGAVVMLLDQDITVAIIIAVAMIMNLVIAGFFGALVPLIMKRLGKDPASSATIFITTATDVFGFLIFLGLATLFLR